MTGDEPTVPVHADDAEDIIALLGIVEDWLRHASDEVRDELAAFTGHTPRALTLLIDDLGHQAVRLRHALRAAYSARTQP
jgi:hypothetical protein